MSKIDCKQVVNGILLVNKPQGLSSNALLQQVKRLYRAKKAGHCGTLDPLATGKLVICFGEATKFCQYLLDSDKCYQATGLLGIKTNTGDALGEITAESLAFMVTKSKLLTILNQFKGPIKQIPSMFSALKHKGTPLYKYARKGIRIEPKVREVTIYDIELTAFDGKVFSINVSCSKGTYIRNLVEDIGDRLGVGAHVIKLHRLSTAGFTKEPMYSLDDLQDKTSEELLARLLPIDRAVAHFPALNLHASEVLALRQGKIVPRKIFANSHGCVRLYDEEAQFVGLGELQSAGILMVKRLLTNHHYPC
jgi:tRNA pseudouridine55 synthase